MDLLKELNIQETQIISEILNQAMGTKQIQKMNSQKTASIILSVVYGIKQQQMLLENDNLTLAQFDFETVEQDTRFAISLILNGLMASPT